MTEEHESRSRIERALKDPSSVFDSPEHVVRDSRLNDDERRRILERWEVDANLLQVATEENMPSPESEDGALLQRVRRAIDALDARSDD